MYSLKQFPAWAYNSLAVLLTIPKYLGRSDKKIKRKINWGQTIPNNCCPTMCKGDLQWHTYISWALLQQDFIALRMKQFRVKIWIQAETQDLICYCHFLTVGWITSPLLPPHSCLSKPWSKTPTKQATFHCSTSCSIYHNRMWDSAIASWHILSHKLNSR